MEVSSISQASYDLHIIKQFISVFNCLFKFLICYKALIFFSLSDHLRDVLAPLRFYFPGLPYVEWPLNTWMSNLRKTRRHVTLCMHVLEALPTWST